jgi:hypothetical protein
MNDRCHGMEATAIVVISEFVRFRADSIGSPRSLPASSDLLRDLFAD